MSRTVHWLHAETLTLGLKHKHILLVGGVMAGGLPKFQIENVRGQNFIVSSHTVLLANHIHKFVIDLGSMGVKESTTR
jgi:hypothetical protein